MGDSRPAPSAETGRGVLLLRRPDDEDEDPDIVLRTPTRDPQRPAWLAALPYTEPQRPLAHHRHPGNTLSLGTPLLSTAVTLWDIIFPVFFKISFLSQHSLISNGDSVYFPPTYFPSYILLFSILTTALNPASGTARPTYDLKLVGCWPNSCHCPPTLRLFVNGTYRSTFPHCVLCMPSMSPPPPSYLGIYHHPSKCPSALPMHLLLGNHFQCLVLFVNALK